ncbi:MAG: prepilin peptidase [Eubacterium sp.]|nr:prepilin peptidase [Eubacterium sp.]
MASTCPNCGRRLKWYDVKAECKDCGVSIPNFNWEARLEEDSELAEKKFASFYRTLNMFAYSLWGTKLRIARIILSFIPIVGFIVPWGYLKSDGESVGIDVIGAFTDGKSLIDLFKSFFGNSGLYFQNMGYEGYSGPVTYMMLAVLFMVLCLLMAVIAFFMILFTNKHPKSKLMVVFDCLSISCAAVSAVMITLAGKTAASAAAFNFGDIPMINAGGGIMWGIFVAIGLLTVALVANILVAKAPAKTHEQLEEERLARKAAKEEKERLAAIEKEKARKEAEKKAAEEQKRIVEEARAKLAKDKEKKN